MWAERRIFRLICKVAKSDCKFHHVCLSARSHNSTPTGGFSWNLTFVNFSKILRQYSENKDQVACILTTASTCRWLVNRTPLKQTRLTLDTVQVFPKSVWTYLLLPYFFSTVALTTPSVRGSPHYGGFTMALRHTTIGRTPLDEWSARRRDFYLTTHNNHKKQTSIQPRWDSNPQPQQGNSYRPTL